MSTTKKKYNLFQEVFGRIWAIWGMITFVVTFLIIFIPSMLSYLFKDYTTGQKYFIVVGRVWMRIWLFLIASPVKVFGWGNFAKGENYVVTFNHNTFMDVPLSAPFVPGGNKTIAKDTFKKVPIFSYFYQRGGVMVNRDSERSRIKSFDAMKKVLAMGMHMCIYPEGTRNRTADVLKPFYDGAFKLAISSQKAVMPCVLLGTKSALPIHKTFMLLPTRLQMHFLPPVPVKDKSVKELKQTVYDAMEEFLLVHRNKL